MAPRKRKTTEEDVTATAAVTGGADAAAMVGAAAGGAPRRSPRMHNSDGAGAGNVAEPAKEKPVKKGRAKKEKEVGYENAAEAKKEEVIDVAEKPAVKKGRGKKAKIEEKDEAAVENPAEKEVIDVAEKPAVKKGRGKKAKIEEKDEAAEENPAGAMVKERPAKKGRGKKAKVAEKEEKEVGEEAEEEKDEVTADGDSGGAEEEEAEKETGHVSKTIVIEHCKQCNAFKTRAIMAKEGLEKAIDGITVLINPEKQRKGCFEIREEGGEIFISLLDMKRPFQPMKALDMEKVISDIIEKIK